MHNTTMVKVPRGFVNVKPFGTRGAVEGDFSGFSKEALGRECFETLARQTGRGVDSPAPGLPGLVNIITSPTVSEGANKDGGFEGVGEGEGRVITTNGKMRIGGLRKWMKLYLLCVDAFGAFPGRWAMVTLTYRYVEAWRPGHISEFLDCVREWARRKKICLPYFWVAELQHRGAVHYHVLFKLPKGVTLPMPDKRGWWKHGSREAGSRVEWVRKDAEAYLGKYLQKGNCVATSCGGYPKGLRLFGYGKASLVDDGLLIWRYKRSPAWVREVTSAYEPAEKIDGYWWDIEGHLLRSPWCVTVLPGGEIEFVRRRAAPWEMLTSGEVQDYRLRLKRELLLRRNDVVEGMVSVFDEVLDDWAQAGFMQRYQAGEVAELRIAEGGVL